MCSALEALARMRYIKPRLTLHLHYNEATFVITVTRSVKLRPASSASPLLVSVARTA